MKHHRSNFWQVKVKGASPPFFSCPEQLNRWPCHSVTESAVRTFLIEIQRATQETCDIWDIWSESWRNMTWPTCWNFLTMLTFFNNFDNSWQFDKFCQFLTVFDNFDNSDSFDNLEQFMTILAIYDSFWQFWYFLVILTTWCFFTFLTIFGIVELFDNLSILPILTILTIHDNLCDLTFKSDTGQHLQFLRCLILFSSAGSSNISFSLSSHHSRKAIISGASVDDSQSVSMVDNLF